MCVFVFVDIYFFIFVYIGLHGCRNGCWLTCVAWWCRSPLQPTLGTYDVLSVTRLPYSELRLSLHTSEVITAVRRRCHVPKDALQCAREWTNDALLSGQSLTSLRHPLLPMAVVL